MAGGLYGYIYFSKQEYEVTFLDVGQGDAILFETPEGQVVLVDGGPDRDILAKLGRELPFYERYIDLVVLTHPHADHINGLVEVLSRYEVGMVLETGVECDTAECQEWDRLIMEKSIPVTVAQAGQLFQFGELGMKVLYPFESFRAKKMTDQNDASVVIKTSYGEQDIMLTGDAPVETESELVQAYGRQLESEILKVGHHGSKYSSSVEFLEMVNPDTAIIQCGEDNRFGHPHEIVVSRLEVQGIEVLRNDEIGDIRK